MRLQIQGVHVFDGEELLKGKHTVDVEGTQVRAQSSQPGGEVIDFSHLPDATLLPGLIDTHVHFALSGADQAEKADPAPLVALRMAQNAEVNLRAGITTVRDMGAKEHIDLQFREATNRGFVRSPRYLVSGKPIIATGGHCAYMGRQVDGATDARRATREQILAGVDWVKMMVTGGIMTRNTDPRTQQLFDDEIESVIRTAHAANVPVAAHCQGGPAVISTIRAGVDSLEHGIWLTDEAIDLMLEHGTAYVPTLSAFYLIARGDPVNGVHPPKWAVDKAIAATEAHQVSFPKAVAAGVRIVAGTDYKHGSLPYEMSLMADWGMPTIDVLRSATSRAAEMLRLQNVGRVRPGMEADLIVVNGNPTRDIRNLENIELIVQRGEVVYRKADLSAEIDTRRKDKLHAV